MTPIEIWLTSFPISRQQRTFSHKIPMPIDFFSRNLILTHERERDSNEHITVYLFGVHQDNLLLSRVTLEAGRGLAVEKGVSRPKACDWLGGRGLLSWA